MALAETGRLHLGAAPIHHLRRILREWIRHYNRGRPHSSLGPGMPEPSSRATPRAADRHCLPTDEVVHRDQSLVDCIRNISWRKRRLETRTDYLRTTGIGVVYKAEDTRLDRTVARKFLAPHLLHEGEAK